MNCVILLEKRFYRSYGVTTSLRHSFSGHYVNLWKTGDIPSLPERPLQSGLHHSPFEGSYLINISGGDVIIYFRHAPAIWQALAVNLPCCGPTIQTLATNPSPFMGIGLLYQVRCVIREFVATATCFWSAQSIQSHSEFVSRMFILNNVSDNHTTDESKKRCCRLTDSH